MGPRLFRAALITRKMFPTEKTSLGCRGVKHPLQVGKGVYMLPTGTTLLHVAFWINPVGLFTYGAQSSTRSRNWKELPGAAGPADSATDLFSKPGQVSYTAVLQPIYQ